MSQKFELTDKWKFKISSGKKELESFNEWKDASVPGTVHTDLLNNKLIDEPFYDDNELKLDWISKNNWIYKTNFDLPKNFNENLPYFLIFEGLDTVTEIKINGSLLGTTDNMFLKYEFDVSSLLKKTDNELIIHFESPTNYSKSLEEKFGKLPVALKSERVYIRKAQYSFEWDWGPSFPTMGIWRNVYLLQRKKIFIKSFNFSTITLSENFAEVEASLKLGGKTGKNFKINSKLSFKEQLIEQEAETSGKDEIKVRLNISNPHLWWPNGEGDQSLYNFEAVVKDVEENVLELFNKKVGIRTIELRLKENEQNTFKIVVNDRPVYAKGVNWIPADSFLPRVTKDKYEKLLRFAKDGNMNIIRVWGGGIYENDIFYELCDELGLLVWQDFMFACASYPEHETFLNNVKEEVKQNVERLQHHPSIAVWCGNNENEKIWYQVQKRSYKEMPGYKIYNKIIPGILKKTDPLRPYWQSSPFGFDEDPNSHNSGNRHEWGIWSKWIDYSEVKNDNSLFVTEFGFQGPANKKTLEKYLSKDHHSVQDAVFEFHNKQVEGPERIFKFLSGHLPVKTEWDDFLYLAQLNQALALKTCIEHWRMNPATNGSIIWQINDCWPVTSWAIIDSELTPKIAYHFVKNIFNQVVVSFKDEGEAVSIVGLNQKKYDLEFVAKIQAYEDKSGELIYEEKTTPQLKAGTKKEIHKLSYHDLSEKNKWTLVTSLYDENDKLLFRNFYTAGKWKYKSLHKAVIKIKFDQNEIKLSTDKPAYFVDLYHPGAEFEDRGFILLPREEKKIKMLHFDKPIRKENLKLFSLNNYLHR